MNTLKLFIKLLIIFVAFYFFVDLICFVGIKLTHYKLDGTIEGNTSKIEITSTDSTSLSGTIKGNITNNSKEILTNKYIRLDLFSEKNTNLGSKYVKIDNLKENETKEFEIDYRARNAKKYIVTVVEKEEMDDKTLELIKFDKQKAPVYLLTTLILMYFFL